MSDFKLTDDHDLAIENNNLVIITRTDEVRQLLIERLRTWKNEYFLDTSIGVPYYEDILKKDIQPAIVEAVLINEILATPGVKRLEEFSVDLDARRNLSCSFKVLATTDEIIAVTEGLA